MIKAVRRYVFLLIGITIVFPVVTHAVSFAKPIDEKQGEGTETPLPAVAINGNYIFPVGGADSIEARKLISVMLTDLNHRIGDGSLHLAEITTTEAWNNAGVQLFKVYGFGWSEGIAVVKDKEVLAFFYGMQLWSLFLSDLDQDGTQEIYANAFMGSGISSEEIVGYNIVRNESYSLQMREFKDFHLYIKNGILMTEISPYPYATNKSPVKNARVILKTSGDSRILSYE